MYTQHTLASGTSFPVPWLKMATGKIRADINFINPYPHAKIRARARAHNPQRVGNETRTRYPRIPAGTPVYLQILENQAHKHILIVCKY